MFSLLLFAVELYLLEVARPRAALAIPLLMPLWANRHGAFLVGIGLLAIEVAAAAWRRDRSGAVRYLLVTAASVAGLLVNLGVGVLGYAVSLPTNEVVLGMITEWAPTSIHDLTGILVLGAVVVLVVALVSGRPAPRRVPEQLLRMALLGGLAFWAVRGSRGSGWPCRWRCAHSPGHRRLAGHQPAAGTDVQLPGVGLLPGVPPRAAGGGRAGLPAGSRTVEAAPP